MKLTKAHPNATTAGASSASVLVVVWIAQMLGADLSPELAVVFSGVWAAIVLAIGRNGIRGVVRKIWHGSSGKSA